MAAGDVRILVIGFILVVGKGAALVFVATVAIYEYVSAEGIFVFWSESVCAYAHSHARQPKACCLPRALTLGEPTWRRSSLDWYRGAAMVSYMYRVCGVVDYV